MNGYKSTIISKINCTPFWLRYDENFGPFKTFLILATSYHRYGLTHYSSRLTSNLLSLLLNLSSMLQNDTTFERNCHSYDQSSTEILNYHHEEL